MKQSTIGIPTLHIYGWLIIYQDMTWEGILHIATSICNEIIGLRCLDYTDIDRAQAEYPLDLSKERS